tara:strand:+ start:456 stop:833 length:378 start_codon:yes stop_codon:yes gene_type:complete
MSIYNDCKIIINLNQLVKDRPCGKDLDDEHVDNIAGDLRKRMTFDSLFGQVDTAIWEYAEDCGIDLSESEECREFGFTIPQYGEIQPEPGREAYLNQIEKNKKEFELVDLVSPSWTIKVPRRKKK